MECFFFTGRVIQLQWSWVEMKTIIIWGDVFILFLLSQLERPLSYQYFFFWRGYTFFGIYFRLLVLISIVELGILGLGLASIPKIAFCIGFLFFSILGLLIYSFSLIVIGEQRHKKTQNEGFKHTKRGQALFFNVDKLLFYIKQIVYFQKIIYIFQSFKNIENFPL